MAKLPDETIADIVATVNLFANFEPTARAVWRKVAALCGVGETVARKYGLDEYRRVKAHGESLKAHASPNQVNLKCKVGGKIKPLPMPDDFVDLDGTFYDNDVKTFSNNIDDNNFLEIDGKPAKEFFEGFVEQFTAIDADERKTAYERFMSADDTPEHFAFTKEPSQETTNDLLHKISERIGKLENKVNAPFVHTPDRDVKVELSREVTTEVFLSDIHLHPEHSQGHDPAALALIEQVIKAIQPDIIYFGGDIGDYYAASRYDGVPILKTPEAFEGEIEYVRKRVGEIIANAPNARIYWDDEDGNHGRRMKKSVFANASWLINRIKNVEADLDLERYGVQCVRDGFKVGKLAHWHGDDLPGAGAHVAKAKFMRELDNILFGHHHTFSEHIQKKPDGGYYGAFGNGCLQWLSTDYAPRPNWQQGARVVQYSKSGNFHVDKILVHKPSVWSPHAETIYAGQHFKVDMSK